LVGFFYSGNLGYSWDIKILIVQAIQSKSSNPSYPIQSKNLKVPTTPKNTPHRYIVGAIQMAIPGKIPNPRENSKLAAKIPNSKK